MVDIEIWNQFAMMNQIRKTMRCIRNLQDRDGSIAEPMSPCRPQPACIWIVRFFYMLPKIQYRSIQADLVSTTTRAETSIPSVNLRLFDKERCSAIFAKLLYQWLCKAFRSHMSFLCARRRAKFSSSSARFRRDNNKLSAAIMTGLVNARTRSSMTDIRSRITTAWRAKTSASTTMRAMWAYERYVAGFANTSEWHISLPRHKGLDG